ncbi:MAG: malate dehydrogenase (quinone) [Verrucomicrobiota bacterium]|nr:malate dehydrogenase (quinone) [Verrucomicrobiota bacterium]
MKSENQILDPDIILIGSGIMSATLGAMLKVLDPALRIQLYEMTEEFGKEASNGWHNAGTGHAGLCELSYTPNFGSGGKVDVSKAFEIFHQFEHSKQFWSYAVRTGMIDKVEEFINPVPHLSFVYGQEQVGFLKSRFTQMQNHHFFEDMAYTEDREQIREWAPLLLEGRDHTPIAVTKMERGTDINFGTLSTKLIEWLGQQEGCGYATSHRITNLTKESANWRVEIKDLTTKERLSTKAKFVFIGAGGGSLPLLQKSGIKESKGFGGFPIGGQWLICDKPEIVNKHFAKVYGLSPGAAPTMAVPHLDTRIIDGKKSIIFCPYAAWTTKILHVEGKLTDLPRSIRSDNIASLVKVGLYNIPLVRYLIKQGTQSMKTRMKELKAFFPDAREEDWRLIDAGIRVQAIKNEDGDAGIVHFGTEVLTTKDLSLSTLLGASPGASVSTNIILEVIKRCFADSLETAEGYARMKAMIPSFDEDLTQPEMAARQRELSEEAFKTLNCIR